MNFSQDQKWMLFATAIAILLIFIITPPDKKVILLQKDKTEITPFLDSTFLFQKKVIPNRLHHYICLLQSKNIQVQTNYELLLLLSNPIIRKQLANDFQIDSTSLLLHAELADLMQIGMTEIDAQILHFSQRNYQNPFTGTTINLHILLEADAESILEDVGGWAAGNENSLVKNYQLSIEKIEQWKARAKGKKLKFFAEMP